MQLLPNVLLEVSAFKHVLLRDIELKSTGDNVTLSPTVIVTSPTTGPVVPTRHMPGSPTILVAKAGIASTISVCSKNKGGVVPSSLHGSAVCWGSGFRPSDLRRGLGPLTEEEASDRLGGEPLHFISSGPTPSGHRGIRHSRW